MIKTNIKGDYFKYNVRQDEMENLNTYVVLSRYEIVSCNRFLIKNIYLASYNLSIRETNILLRKTNRVT